MTLNLLEATKDFFIDRLGICVPHFSFSLLESSGFNNVTSRINSFLLPVLVPSAFIHKIYAF